MIKQRFKTKKSRSDTKSTPSVTFIGAIVLNLFHFQEKCKYGNQ